MERDWLFTCVYITLSLCTIRLSADQKIKAWPLDILRKGTSLILYYNRGLLVKCCIDILLIAKGFYALYRWGLRPGHTQLRVTRLRLLDTCCLFVLCCVLGGCLGYGFERYFRAAYPYMDGLHAMFVLLTYVLLAHKKLEAWVFWWLANGCFIYVFATQWEDLKSRAMLLKYVVYMVLAVDGWRRWYAALRNRAS